MTVRLLPATALHFARLLAGERPEPEIAQAGAPVAEADVLVMLAALAETVAVTFTPSAWLIVSDHEFVGLMSVTALLPDRALQIGYGVAPCSRRMGHATAAVNALVAWARADERVDTLYAETRTDNIASQRVLGRNGFAKTAERLDEEDGALFCWRIDCRGS